MSIQVWLRMAGYLSYISYRYIFISSFASLTNYAVQKLNNLMWLRMAEEFMSRYFHGYSFLDNVSFIDFREQDMVSVKCGYVWREKSSIYSTVVYLAYIMFY